MEHLLALRPRLPSWLLRGAGVLGTLGFALLLGALMGSGRGRYALLLIAPVALVGILSLAFYRFELLVLALPLVALVLPRVELPTGTDTRLPLSLLLALLLTAVWALSMLVRREWRLTPSPLNMPLLSFAAVTIVSLGWSLAWRDPGLISDSSFIVTQFGALATILVSLSAALLIGNFVTTKRQLNYLLGCFLVFGGLMLLTQLFAIPQSLLNDRGLWASWLIACAYGLLIIQPGLAWHWRALLVAVLVMTLYQTMVVTSGWISGWMPGLVAIAAITFLRSRGAFFPVVLIAGAAIYLSLGFFESVAQANIDDGSLERLIIYQQSWRVFREHPLLGTGPAGYAIYYMSYFPNEARSTHNNYLDIIAQFGVIGSVVWLWLMGVSLWEGWRLARRAPPGILRTVTIIATGGWVGALFAMVLGDWVLPFAYNQGIAGYKYTVFSWIFLGTLIAVRRMVAAESDGL